MKNKELSSSNGIDFLLKTGIKEVSSRTFIHEDELKKFLNGDFQGINKTKAMGFIQILEREFNIDLSDLKSKYVAYMNEHKTEVEEPKQSLMMEEVEKEQKKRGLFSFIFLLAAIGTIAYLIDKYNLLDFTTPNDIKTAQVLNEKDINLSLEKLTQPEKPKIVENVKKDEPIVSSDAESDKIDDTQKDLSLNNILASEDNKTTQKNSLDNSNGELDLSKLNQDLKVEEKKEENNQLTENNTTDNQEEVTQNDSAISNEIYIIPSHKVWIGTIDLDTYKKKDFLAPKGKRINIEATTNKLIMIGHKFVKLYLNGEVVKFKRKGPIRFKYIDGVLTEIDRQEFNQLAKGRQW